MQLGTQTNALGGPSFLTSLAHTVATGFVSDRFRRARFSALVAPHYSPARTRASASAPTHYSSLVTQHRGFLIAGEKILKTELTPSVPTPNAFLIAGVCATFSPAAPPISNRYAKLLEIALTLSQQTRKHFLIATIRPTFASVPLFTHHSSLITSHRLTSILFDTNKPNKIIILMRTLMKTKENRFSIRYKFALRGTGPLAEGGRFRLCASLRTPQARVHRPNIEDHSQGSRPSAGRPLPLELPLTVTAEYPPVKNHAVLVPPSRAAVKWIAFQHAPLTERGATL